MGYITKLACKIHLKNTVLRYTNDYPPGPDVGALVPCFIEVNLRAPIGKEGNFSPRWFGDCSGQKYS